MLILLPYAWVRDQVSLYLHNIGPRTIMTSTDIITELLLRYLLI
jgi:hypothetical protein